MTTYEIDVPASYDQIVAAWSVLCFTFNGLVEVSHTYRLSSFDNHNNTPKTSAPNTFLSHRSDMLRHTHVALDDADISSSDIHGLLLETAQPRQSALTRLTCGSSSKSDTLVLLITRGKNSYGLETMGLSQPHLICRIDESSLVLEVPCPQVSDCGEASQVERLVESFCLAIKRVVKHWHLNTTLHDINIFSDQDRSQVLDWNATSHASACEPAGSTLLDRIQAISRKAGSCLALGSSERMMSYADLDSLSDALAAKLLQHTQQASSFVPIVGNKSIWAVIAMLAVWKCGAAFVLISPDLPSERQQSIVAQLGSEISLVVNRHDVEIADVDFCTIQERYPHLAKLGSDLLPGCNLSDPAYVIFTSGTTGQPKGVVIEHHSISKSMICLAEASGLNSTTRMLQYASFTFDACILEIFSTLIVGGAVYIPTDAERNDDLPAYIRQYDLNTMLLTPSVLQTLEPMDVPTMHTVLTGGEKMSALTVERWSSRTRLLNAYGPTETSVLCSLLNQVTSKTPPENIGKALGSSLWIVDVHDSNRLVPCGAVGELVVCGTTLARGYLNDSESTSKSFLSSPAWLSSLHPTELSPSRAYCTGDLVRYDADGFIHIIGRKDQQVKLRGQRIELAEIELAVRSLLPYNSEIAIDVTRPGGSDNAAQLVLFVVIQPEDDFGVSTSPEVLTSSSAIRQLGTITEQLSKQLKELLPKYMIPSVFIPISVLPLTRSAKLDRAALRSWVECLTATDLASLAGPSSQEDLNMRTQTEEDLRELWGHVLGLSPGHISRKSHFFRLGGDSIKAMQLVASSRRAGYTITVETTFRYPSLSEMSLHAHHASGNEHEEWCEPPPFSLIDRHDNPSPMSSQHLEELKHDVSAQCEVAVDLIEDIYPCTALQEGMLALTMQNPDAYATDFTFESSSVDIARLEQAWDQVVQRTSVLRTRFVSGASEGFLQVVIQHQPGTVNIEEGPDSSVFQFALGSPSNRILIRSSENGLGASITWSAHHATYDAITVQHVINEVEALYNKQELLPLRNFATFIRGTRISKNDVITRKFWTTCLEGSETTAFPGQPLSHIVRAAASSSRTIMFSQHARRGITAANTVRAAWALVLSQYTDSDDVVFGVTTSGRTVPIPDIDMIRGPTIATAPVRVSIPRQATLKELLSTVQEEAVAMIPFENFGLQNIQTLSPSAALACDLRSLLILQFPESGFTQDHGTVMLNTSGPMEDVYTYPLNIQCVFEGDAITATAKYDDALMSDVQAKRVLASFDAAIQAVVQLDDSILAHDLKQVSDMDIEAIMEWNRNAPTTVGTPINELIMEQAHRQPEAPAVSA